MELILFNISFTSLNNGLDDGLDGTGFALDSFSISDLDSFSISDLDSIKLFVIICISVSLSDSNTELLEKPIIKSTRYVATKLLESIPSS